jgi:hypothetical protein
VLIGHTIIALKLLLSVNWINYYWTQSLSTRSRENEAVVAEAIQTIWDVKAIQIYEALKGLTNQWSDWCTRIHGFIGYF